MEWITGFFGTGGKGTLVLQPDKSATKLAGFKDGKSLDFSAQSGETVGQIMDRFNVYRGPDQQITQVWTTDGTSLPFSTVVTGRLIAIVRG
jgi:hypothetical protein